MAEPIKVTKTEHYVGNDFFEMMKRRFKEELEDRSEMHLQVGRTIVALSDIEQRLEMVFALFSLPISEERSVRTFHGTQNFNRKLELVDYAVLRSGERELHAPWNELSERIKQQKVVRNLAAHASIYFRQEKGARRSRAVISASSYGERGKSKELGIPDVKRAADELEAIARDIIRFFSPTLRAITKARNITVDPW
ncbi:hypothetical protein [Bradyrhizobium sp. TM239]|uniref:hypothetical protein n=1 Tax=Bradyrhizobium sp. TM239 TaxID=2599802 RepID=UPI0027D4D163|nr:hypothetical protein TM239_32720 [Bradyrhizobium sp. TM239]